MDPVERIANAWIPSLSAYEPGRPIEEVAREVGFDCASAIKLASNENALGPSPHAVAAMRDAAAKMHVYPDGGGFYLTEALAEQLAVSPDAVVLTNGSNEGIELLSHVFLSKGDEIVMSEHAFVIYRLCASVFQAQTVAVPMLDHRHDLQAMLAAITDKTRLVFIANPNNPTGTMISESEIDAFMSRVPEHVIVVIDEAYVELLPPDRQPNTLSYVRAGRRVVLLRTFSKTYGLAGLRIGYAVAPTGLTALLQKVRQPFNVSAMAQIGALAALTDHVHVERTRALVTEELAFYEAAFDRMGIGWIPSVANFICADVGNGRDVFERLQQRGVIVRPMDGYRLAAFIRITIGTRPENERCVVELKAIRAASG